MTDVQQRIQECATEALSILKELDPELKLQKDPVTPAETLHSYARAIAARLPQTSLLVADLCSDNPRFHSIVPFVSKVTVEDLKTFSSSEFEEMLGPRNLLTARVFIKTYPHYFRSTADNSAASDVEIKAPTVDASGKTSSARKIFQVDGSVSVDFQNEFITSEPKPLIRQNAEGRPVLTEEAVLEKLEELDVDTDDVSSINFSRSMLHDADLNVLQRVIARLPNCRRLDISFNRLLQLNRAEDRNWLLGLLRSSVFVLMIGMRNAVTGTDSLLQHVARTAPDLLQHFIWLNPGLVEDVYIWNELLGEPATAESTWHVCYDAHRAFYAADGIKVGPPGPLT